MYQQRPLKEGAGVFEDSWWPRCWDRERAGGEGVRPERVGTGVFPIARVLSIDPSVKMFHGLVVADVLYDRDRFLPIIIDAKRWKGPQRSIITEIQHFLQAYRPDFFIFEDVSFIQWLKEDPFYEEIRARVKVIPHQTGRNKGDADMGVESLAREAEFGNIRLPYKDERGREISSLIMEEANAWPSGRTTDVLMALWFIKWNYKRLKPRDAYTATSMNWIPGADGVWAGFERRTA
jgi:hypothetical protein